jgi:hypothetical protein
MLGSECINVIFDFLLLPVAEDEEEDEDEDEDDDEGDDFFGRWTE